MERQDNIVTAVAPQDALEESRKAYPSLQWTDENLANELLKCTTVNEINNLKLGKVVEACFPKDLQLIEDGATNVSQLSWGKYTMQLNRPVPG